MPEITSPPNSRRRKPTATVIRELSAFSKELSEQLFASREQERVKRLLATVGAELLEQTQRDFSERQVADAIGQTLVQSRIAWESANPQLHALQGQPGVFPPAGNSLGDLLRTAIGVRSVRKSCESWPGAVEQILGSVDRLVRSFAESFRENSDSTVDDSTPLDFDTFLAAHDPRSRAQHGVYFTPQCVAAAVVEEVDRLLRVEFALVNGLADTTTWSHVLGTDKEVSGASMRQNLPFVQLLDPAVGTGVFLVEVIGRITATWNGLPETLALSAQKRVEAWNEYVARFLIPRLAGVDILLPACAVTWIRMAEKLACTGYRFEAEIPFDIACRDSLQEPRDAASPGAPRGDSKRPVSTVIVGNPPFAALTTSSNPWIDGLLRAETLHERQVGGFYDVDGLPLGEKKLWLHDDYVKFLRYAQWQIEQVGAGIVGFVTNHGYLDNLTFRGARQSLLRTFPRVSVLDLHGNRKKRETTSTGGRDESIFRVDQGVAIGFFRRPLQTMPTAVMRADAWGTREHKLSLLRNEFGNVDWEAVSPQSPYYLLHDDSLDRTARDEYRRGFLLSEIMPVNSTAAVTARDSFTIAFTPEELVTRLRCLADDEVEDEELRRRFFNRTRSNRYPAGDTRGWKLPKARHYARQLAEPGSIIRRCLYRPFDWRWILWADWLVDWPRSEVMKHMVRGENLAIVTRRQMIPNQPANYFFVADSIVIDGLIRSDNRGSESFFPLYLNDDHDDFGQRRNNFSEVFYARCREVLSPSSVSPEDLFHMIYAQFHSSQYRQRYQSELCLDFPRVFLPRNKTLYETLVDLGRTLVAAHLFSGDFEPSMMGRDSTPAETRAMPTRDYPRHVGNEIQATDDWCLKPVASEVWEYRVGGHHVCRKWLRDRTGRLLPREDKSRYCQLIKSVTETVQTVEAIDSEIALAGGWPAAFVGDWAVD